MHFFPTSSSVLGFALLLLLSAQKTRAQENYCLRITTGSNAWYDGYLRVSVNEDNGNDDYVEETVGDLPNHALNSIVVAKCYSNHFSVQVQNPHWDGANHQRARGEQPPRTAHPPV